ncbi:uncharacterized protein UTRI_03633 [Ustilago trichophora]|uniref:Uncharacterized protein n=1 Tax=Ustilago trichophora TaxID=86804 RepID=A0A5C3E2D7_9BASI|nr:uncharacterized protein UTRI_03633 [Ustilago trichophora]
MLFPKAISWAAIVALTAASCALSLYLPSDTIIWYLNESTDIAVARLNGFLDEVSRQTGQPRPPRQAAADFFEHLRQRGVFAVRPNWIQAAEWNQYYYERLVREHEEAARAAQERQEAAARAAQEERETAARAAREEHPSEDPAAWAAALYGRAESMPETPRRRSRWWG